MGTGRDDTRVFDGREKHLGITAAVERRIGTAEDGYWEEVC
jgi:hypothetical protein